MHIEDGYTCVVEFEQSGKSMSLTYIFTVDNLHVQKNALFENGETVGTYTAYHTNVSGGPNVRQSAQVN